MNRSLTRLSLVSVTKVRRTKRLPQLRHDRLRGDGIVQSGLPFIPVQVQIITRASDETNDILS